MENFKNVFEVLNLKGSFSNPMIEDKVTKWLEKVNPESSGFLINTDWNQLFVDSGKLVEVDIDANTRHILTSNNELERIYKRFFPSKKLENLSPREIYALTKEQKEERSKLSAERLADMEEYYCNGCNTCYEMGYPRHIGMCPYKIPEWVKEEFSDLL